MIDPGLLVPLPVVLPLVGAGLTVVASGRQAIQRLVSTVVLTTSVIVSAVLLWGSEMPSAPTTTPSAEDLLTMGARPGAPEAIRNTTLTPLPMSSTPSRARTMLRAMTRTTPEPKSTPARTTRVRLTVMRPTSR